MTTNSTSFLCNNCGASPLMSLFGVVFIGFAIFTIVKGVNTADEFSDRKRVHEERRAEIMEKIQKSR